MVKIKSDQSNVRFIGILFTFAIIFSAWFVSQYFLAPLAWAAIIALVSWPLHKLISSYVKNNLTAAIASTFFVSLIILIPFYALATSVAKEVFTLAQFISLINKQGLQAPAWLQNIPTYGQELANNWNVYLNHPDGFKTLAKINSENLAPVTQFVKNIGFELARRGVIAGFTLMSLFFFFKDGKKFAEQANLIGEYCLGDRWNIYLENLPQAIRATVNGSVLVGFGVGLIMAVAYSFTSLPAPILFGLGTAIFAMIPFGAPMVFAIVVMILLAQGNLIGALLILIFGSLVLFFADHFIRPSIIGNATKLPFLAVLFGILGGIESLGLIGLFVGPIIMVLFLTLWREPLLIQKYYLAHPERHHD